jgi:polar amino acid transport system substrate-binding protein
MGAMAFLRNGSVAVMLCLAGAAHAAKLQLVTEYSPPDMMREGERIVGITPEILRLALASSGIDYSMEMLAWRRAYSLALRNPDTCVFSTARTPEREALFKWIGPVREVDWTFFALAGAEHKLTTLEDARPLRIGSYNGDVRALYLEKRGYKVDSTQDDFTNPKKLVAGRIDLWVTDLQTGRTELARQGWTGKIVPVLTFHATKQYLACNLAVPDATVAALNAAIAGLHQDGTAAGIERKYADWQPKPK